MKISGLLSIHENQGYSNLSNRHVALDEIGIVSRREQKGVLSKAPVERAPYISDHVASARFCSPRLIHGFAGNERGIVNRLLIRFISTEVPAIGHTFERNKFPSPPPTLFAIYIGCYKTKITRSSDQIELF